MAMTVAASLVTAMVSAVTLLGSAPAEAAPGDAFDPKRPTVFVAQSAAGETTRLYRSETTGDGSYAFTPEGPAVSSGNYNAIGFNSADNYIYGTTVGVVGTIPGNALIQIGQGGAVKRVGTVEFPRAQWAGAFNPTNNLFYLSNGTPANSRVLYAVNTNTGQIVSERTLSLTDYTFADFEYHDGFFWAFDYGAGQPAGTILRINPANGAMARFPGVIPNAAAGPWGAAWKFGNGNLAFSNNTTGTIAQLRIANGASASPTFTVVSMVKGPPSNGNDGTAIPGNPVDLQITKTAASAYTPGGNVSYTLTVRNNGAGESSGWVVQDAMPAQLSNITTSGDATCEVTGSDISCAGGRLAAGATATITVTGTTAASERSCFTNTATVVGNEFDPTDANNTASAEVCARLVEITKTSDATANTRVGDTVTYTVTATNTGTVDYTAAEPARVSDSLTGVLDDASYNSDATASRPGGTLSYTSPVLSWSGALPAGQSVALTYSVTLTAGGDGAVRNVAWSPRDPGVSNPPACSPAPNGFDAVTGEACAEVEFALPRLTIRKSADRTELPAVGESVEYTITVTNPGPGAYTAASPASFTDDLSNVLDAADYNNDAAASSGNITYTEPVLTWSGALAAGQSATVTYTAEYTGEGDRNLRNLACLPENQVLPGAAACDLVQIPGADLTQWKQVRASDTPAVAGTVLTYTLFFKNDGEAAATVDAIDDLTHVLDDASVTVEPSASNGLAATRADTRIAVTGTVPAGTTSSVTYQVTLNEDGERGDDIAANFLMQNDPDNPPLPPATPDCVPTDTQLPNCTSTPIAAISYAKSVTASATPVAEGTVLNYTITIENTGTVAGPVSREDVLTDVLDDAELTSAPTSDTPSVTVSAVAGERFAIGGRLAAGDIAKVTYAVTVRADADRGNNSANNFLVPSGGQPPATCVADDTSCTSTPMPLISADKAVAPESGTAVVAGQDVTYTLTFTNSGSATGDVAYTDHLTGVLDDAALTAGPTASDPVLSAALGAGDTLTVTGSLAAGQTETITYTVTVLADGQRGDNRLGNVLAPTGVDEPACGDVGVSCTDNPIPLLSSWKTVTADTTPVAAGTVLTYTLHFENTGEATASVDQIDDLTHVTDDADVTLEPASDDLTVSRDGNRIAVTGQVPAGETATVTYRVTLRADGDRGDDIAANFLMQNDPDNPPTPPAEPVCQPDNAERPDCTVTPIGRLLTGKSVSADTDPIDVGTVLTYTLTFDNQGEAPVAVDHTDHLAGVLDDATLTRAPSPSARALTASAVENGRFSVTGELAAGQTVIVTYQVTINAEDARGDNVASNFLVATGEQPPAECTEANPNCTATPLPMITPVKSADPEAGSSLQAGQQVTYTLSFTNSGAASGVFDYTDRLHAVLDDADLTTAPVSSDPALVVSSGADGLVRVTGSLAPEQTVTVSYTVTVKADGERGDNVLRNVVAKSGLPDPECGAAGVACTEHPIGELAAWKTVDPASGATVRPGATATYTLHFENTGNAPVDVSRDDILTDVLDDAEMTRAPAASSDALTASGIADGRFTVSGTLAAGESVTVSYTVTVKPDGQRGDDRLGNFLVPNGELPPEGGCAPADPERPDCTVNHVSNVTVVKSSDPRSGTELTPNSKVTYTLTFANVSASTDSAPVDIDYTDHMADVLDDATLTAAPKASSAELAATVQGDRIRITGAVAAGKVVTVSYTVTVKAYDRQGNHSLGNVVAITGEEPVCAPASPLCTQHDLIRGPDLATTGGALAWGAAAMALLLIVGGAVVVHVGRRRESILTE